MPSQNVTLLLYPMISTRGDLVSVSCKHVYNVLIKIDDVKLLNLIRGIRELDSPKEELILTILCWTGIMVQI